MNNTFKQALPVTEGGDAAEAYLFSVRQQANELGSVFSVSNSAQEPPLNLGAKPRGKVVQETEFPVNMALIHEECGSVFGSLPENCLDPAQFWKRAAPLVAALEDVDLGLNGKESWKSYIKENSPVKLSHQDLFIAIKVLSKMQPGDRGEHLQIWGWCLLLQVPTLLTGSEIGILRYYAQLYQDGFWLHVLAACFGQTDLVPNLVPDSGPDSGPAVPASVSDSEPKRQRVLPNKQSDTVLDY